jgi:uracil phosphoribosyltransferase
MPINGSSTDALTTEFGPNVHISSHPVLRHKITILRSSNTQPGEFRRAMREVTYHLGYEATSGLTTQPVEISVEIPNQTEHMNAQGDKLVERIAMIPILRSGLGMVDALCDLIPNAAIHHIGMYKSFGQSTTPVQYFNRLPKVCSADVAYVLDPVISTASTVLSVVGILKKVRREATVAVNLVCCPRS